MIAWDMKTWNPKVRLFQSKTNRVLFKMTHVVRGHKVRSLSTYGRHLYYNGIFTPYFGCDKIDSQFDMTLLCCRSDRDIFWVWRYSKLDKIAQKLCVIMTTKNGKWNKIGITRSLIWCSLLFWLKFRCIRNNIWFIGKKRKVRLQIKLFSSFAICKL